MERVVDVDADLDVRPVLVDFDELDVEDEGGVWWNTAGNSLRAVAHVLKRANTFL